MTTEEILRWSKEGRPAEEIIQEMRSSRTVYILDSKDVVKLHERGVDDRVIDYMLETRRWDAERRAACRDDCYECWWCGTCSRPCGPHVHCWCW